jgi:branched-chain amino acid transport system permease protein
MGVINLAHGSFYMIGAYFAWSLASYFGNLLTAILVGIVLSVLLGLALERLLIRHFYGRDHLYQVLLTYGLILIFEQLRSLIWGDEVQGVKVPELFNYSIPLTDTLSYPVYRLVISAACVAIALGLHWLIRHTRLGMMIRAGAHNREMTEAMGINVRMLFAVVFSLGVALAALAGMLAAPVSSVYPNMGSQVLIICFVVVVIGGIGSVKGALVGALLIGLADTFGQVYLPQLAGMVVYLLMAAVLVFRPEGLFRKT